MSEGRYPIAEEVLTYEVNNISDYNNRLNEINLFVVGWFTDRVMYFLPENISN